MSALELIRDNQYLLTVNNLLIHDCPEELISAIQVLALCNDGSSRSFGVVEALVDKYEIPAAYVMGGLRLLTSDAYKDSRTGLINAINSFPHVVVTLTWRESIVYSSFLSSVKQGYRGRDYEAAIAAIAKEFGKTKAK